MSERASVAEPPVRAVLAPFARERGIHAGPQWTEGAARQRSAVAASARAALDGRRVFILLPFAIIAGLIVSLAADGPPAPALLWAGGGVLAIACIAAMRSMPMLRAAALISAFWLGFALLSIHGALFGTEMLARPAYGLYAMQVDQVLTHGADGTRLVVSTIVPQEGARQLPIRRARLFVRGDLAIAPGDGIQGPVRFYPVPGPVIPRGFDTQFHSYFDGIGAYASATGTVEVLSREDGGGLARYVEAVRRAIGGRIDAILQQPSAGIARALITGDQSAVPDGARATMATAGLAHVLSISGLHLTLVAGGVFVAVRMLLALSEPVGRHLPVKRLAAIGGIGAALLYFSISGGSVAAVRATIMIILVLGAVIVGRRALTMRNVAIAALIVLVSDPASVFRPSFQLSFAAVVALIGAWELARGQEGRDRNLVQRLFAYFGGIAVTSLVAGAATLLFSMYHFQQTSPLGVLGNLVALPLVGFVMMPSAVIAALMMPFGLEAPFLITMGWSIDRMLDLASLVTAMSAGIDASPLLTPAALILGLSALAWFAFLPTWHRILGPALLVPAVIVLGLDQPPDVLIADTTQAVALRLDGGLHVVAGKADSFAVRVWSETYAEPFEAADVACDSIACIAESSRGFRLAIIKDAAGFYEECATADLVIARRDAPSSCPAGVVVDATDLSEGGVHWLRWDSASQQLVVRRAIVSPQQPWRIQPR